MNGASWLMAGTTVINSFSSREQAEALVADPSSMEGMERAGVIGEPTVTWVEEAERVDYKAGKAEAA